MARLKLGRKSLHLHLPPSIIAAIKRDAAAANRTVSDHVALALALVVADDSIKQADRRKRK